MATEGMQLDEGVAFGRRRGSTPAQPVTPEEVQRAVDVASTELETGRAIPGEEAANLFAPVGGGASPGDASVADQTLFSQQGYNVGPLPPQYQKLFGSDPSVIGWKLETNPDGSQQISVARPQGDASGGLQFQTYGAKIKTDPSGNVSTFVPSGTTSTTTSTTTGLKTAEQIAADELAGEKKAQRQSAYDLLYSQFKLYGLEALVEPLKNLITTGVSPAQFTIELRASKPYQDRFAANAKRIANGFAAIDEATYLGLEDKYQFIMQNYGLPSSYYEKGYLGVQKGFEDLIGGNVDPMTLEDRIVEGQKILKGSKELLDTAKKFYPELNDGDFLGYVLNPKNALSDIKRKVTETEIGASAVQAGLNLGQKPEDIAGYAARAKELAAAGITKAQAAAGYGEIAQFAPRGGQLAQMYGQEAYTQATAETELFGLAGKTEAEKQRKKLTALEQAEFSKKSGIGVLDRERAGAI